MEPEFIGGEVDLRINIYRGQNDTNNARINAKKTKNGVNDIKNGIDGVKISRTKEQVQIEKLLQAIEKNPFEPRRIMRNRSVCPKELFHEYLFLYSKMVCWYKMEQTENRIG